MHRKMSARSGYSTRLSPGKALIRVMALGAVLLAVFQFGTITDPVDFYLKIAGDIDYPAFQYEYLDGSETAAGVSNETIRLQLKAEPSAPVKILQNDKTLGLIGNGITLEVRQGKVTLDASMLSYPVKVEVILNEKSYYIYLKSDIKSFEIHFQEDPAS